MAHLAHTPVVLNAAAQRSRATGDVLSYRSV